MPPQLTLEITVEEAKSVIEFVYLGEGYQSPEFFRDWYVFKRRLEDWLRQYGWEWNVNERRWENT